MPYYAVLVGYTRGVYFTWEDCKEEVEGYPRAIFRKFADLMEAEDFVKNGMKMFNVPNMPRVVTQVYVDGACRGNGRKGTLCSGYGVYFGQGDPRNKKVLLSMIESPEDHRPTNQRAELMAIASAIKAIHNDVYDGHRKDHLYEIVSDSKYAIFCMSRWSDKWLENGWRNTKGGEVYNRDLIEPYRRKLDQANEVLRMRGEEEVMLTYVPGHSGCVGNEVADLLANIGANNYRKYL